MINLPTSALYAVIDSLEAGVVILDHEQRVLYWNQWFATRCGQTAASANGQMLAEALAGIANNRLEQAVAQAIQHRLPALLSPALHGAILPLYQTEQDRRRERRIQQLIHIIPLWDDPRAACLIQISDVTANISRERLLRQQTDMLRRSTTQDEVTGLPNRRTFDAALAQEFDKARKAGRPLALLVGDLDQFSHFNAVHSRDIGDACLKQVGELFSGTLRPVGGLAARYGGDEFALVLPGYNEDNACQLAGKICRQVDALQIAHPDTAPTPFLSLSIGVTVMTPTEDADTDTLLSSADVALYQAKHEGRNRAVYFSVEDGSFRACE